MRGRKKGTQWESFFANLPGGGKKKEARLVNCIGGGYRISSPGGGEKGERGEGDTPYNTMLSIEEKGRNQERKREKNGSPKNKKGGGGLVCLIPQKRERLEIHRRQDGKEKKRKGGKTYVFLPSFNWIEKGGKRDWGKNISFILQSRRKKRKGKINGVCLRKQLGEGEIFFLWRGEKKESTFTRTRGGGKGGKKRTAPSPKNEGEGKNTFDRGKGKKGKRRKKRIHQIVLGGGGREKRDGRCMVSGRVPKEGTQNVSVGAGGGEKRKGGPCGVQDRAGKGKRKESTPTFIKGRSSLRQTGRKKKKKKCACGAHKGGRGKRTSF